jgi:hypothetical protein
VYSSSQHGLSAHGKLYPFAHAQWRPDCLAKRPWNTNVVFQRRLTLIA